MKISIHNVGRGSAVLVELPSSDDGPKRIGIVDCFCGPGGRGPLMSELRSLEQTCELSIEFLVLTHMHADHFIGVDEILKRYGPKIKRFFDPGLDLEAVILAEFSMKDDFSNRARAEIKSIKRFKTRYAERVFALCSPDVQIYADKAHDILVRSIAPNGGMLAHLERVMVKHFEAVRNEKKLGNSEFKFARTSIRNYNLNKTSSALQISTRGKQIVLGGDVLSSAWDLIFKSGVEIEADAFLLSHHGSSDAFPKKQWRSIIKENGHAIVSGCGKGQPAQEVLKFLQERGERIWTTNIPKRSFPQGSPRYIKKHHYAGDPVRDVEAGGIVFTVADGIEIRGPRLN